MKYEVIIIGGGLAGLINAIVLSRAGMAVALVERKMYPFHRVCGEYISNETLPFLHSLGVRPHDWGAASVSQLQVTAPNGTILEMPLDLGGFGLSRYVLDEKLFQLALQAGVANFVGKSAEEIAFADESFTVTLNDHTQLQAAYVIGAYGKRTKLDKQLNREFMNSRSPYVGVKYHIRTNFPQHTIALHNFKDGYCGLSAIENHTYNLCYLTTRENIRKSGSIEAMEAEILQKNPFLKAVYRNSDFLFDKPEVINEISFAPKTAVENHILMSGDSAGMITPLCGNGMAIAIHSAKILSQYLIQARDHRWSRVQLEQTYSQHWKQAFARRLWVGRNLQTLFGGERLTDASVRLLRTIRPLARFLVTQTHGAVF
jgi:flavin-dependent dehydrogenase